MSIQEFFSHARRQLNTALVVTLLLTLTTTSNKLDAQGLDPKAAPAPATGAASAPTPAAEIAVLRAQLETTKQFQDSFIAMAQWTLGTAVAIALAMAVFGWHTNKTNYERDREAIGRESRAAANELKAEVEGELATRLAALESMLTSREKQVIDAAVKQVGGQLSTFAARLSSIQNAIDDLKESELGRESEYWMTKGVHANALRALAELLAIHTRRKSNEYFSSEVLDKIRAIAKDPNANFGADVISQILNEFDCLPAKLKNTSEPIAALLKKKMG